MFKLVVASVVAAAVPLLPMRGAASPSTCAPVDEAPRKPDFFSFRAHLQTAVADHDVQAVLAIVDPKIRNTFGGDDGIEAFKRIWRINEPGSPLWRELGAVLALGGFFEGPDSFVAPYTFRCGEEAFEDAAVVGANVKLRSLPAADATVTGSLTFSVVRLPSGYPDAEWIEVELDDGRKGFVSSRYVRSPIDYRAYFLRSHGRWRMTMLIAGD